jgi:ubiquinone/menaquinone biosynthesis C-methylase UbiE
MARETFGANTLALELLDLQSTDRALELGFGRGLTVRRLAAVLTAGFVAGVDPSAEMCRSASRLNRADIALKRVELRQGRAEDLPYDAQSFGKVLTVHTLYFWPELVRPFAEAARVLRPGGRFVVGYRSDSAAPADFPLSVYRFRGEIEVVAALGGCGFTNLRTSRRQVGGGVVSFTIGIRSAAGS